MFLNISSIPPDVSKRQVVEISEFRRYKPEKDCNMENNLARLKAGIDGSIKSILREKNARLVMLLIAEHDGITITEIRQVMSERYQLALSYAITKRIVSELENENWCIHTEQVQKTTGIKPVYIFRIKPSINPSDIVHVLAEHDKLERQAAINKIVSKVNTYQDIDDPFTLLEEIFNQLRSSVQAKHFELLALIGQNVSTITELADFTGDKRQSIHTRVTRFGEVKIVGRVKRDDGKGLEFHYFLDSGITLEHLKRFALNKGFSLPSVELQSQLQLKSNHQEVKMSSQPDLSESDSVKSSYSLSKYEKLLEYLPKFDPNWTDEVKADWIKAYRQIAELAGKTS